MAVENGNFIGEQERKAPKDFAVYPSGYHPEVSSGSTPGSLETPLMLRVREAHDGATIQSILQKVVAEGHTLRGAEGILGVSDSTLYSWLVRLEVKGRRSRSSSKKQRSLQELKRHVLSGETPEETLAALYATRSLREVGEILGITAPSVRELMIRFGIPRRQPHVNIVPGQK